MDVDDAEVKRAPLQPIKRLVVEVKLNLTNKRRLIGRVANGFHIGNERFAVCMPFQNASLRSVVGGMQKRMAKSPPMPSAFFIPLMVSFLDVWLPKQFDKAPADADVSFETWIDSVPYTLSRKAELKLVFENAPGGLTHRGFIAKGFMKSEGYPTMDKFLRSIASTDDEFKVLFGPYVKVCEKIVFAKPQFIKKVAVSERPRYIYELLVGNGLLLETDYTAFESHYVPYMMHLIKFRVMLYVLSEIPDFNNFMELLYKLAGVRTISFGNFSFSFVATLLSGEMDTSLGNGITNLCISSFVDVVVRKHFSTTGRYPRHLSDVGLFNFTLDDLDLICPIVVEGDDGLKLFPNESADTPDEVCAILSQLVKECGFIVKMEPRQSISQSTFCGILADESELHNISDPIKLMVNFGIFDYNYHSLGMGCARDVEKALILLRCTALSYLHEYPACPIVNAASMHVVQMTNHLSKKTVNYVKAHVIGNLYNWEMLLQYVALPNIPYVDTPVESKTRALCELEFGITPEQQVNIEMYFKTQTQLHPIPLELFNDHIPTEWLTFSERYSVLLDDIHTSYVNVDFLMERITLLPFSGIVPDETDV